MLEEGKMILQVKLGSKDTTDYGFQKILKFSLQKVHCWYFNKSLKVWRSAEKIVMHFLCFIPFFLLMLSPSENGLTGQKF